MFYHKSIQLSHENSLPAQVGVLQALTLMAPMALAPGEGISMDGWFLNIPGSTPTWMSPEVSKWFGSMGYKLYISGVYWGYNPLTNLLLSSWDIQLQDVQKKMLPCSWQFCDRALFWPEISSTRFAQSKIAMPKELGMRCFESPWGIGAQLFPHHLLR